MIPTLTPKPQRSWHRPVLWIFLGLIFFFQERCSLEEIPQPPAVWECGKDFTDPRDGTVYKTVWIAEDGSHDLNKPGQCWLAENLNFNTNTFTSRCYDSNPANCDLYGRVYLENTVSNICPVGWHVPTFEEWKTLFKTYGFTEALTGNGPIYNGNMDLLLNGGNSKLDFLLGGSCSDTNTPCEGVSEYASFWSSDGHFANLGKNSAQVWSRAVIVNGNNLMFYVRGIKN